MIQILRVGGIGVSVVSALVDSLMIESDGSSVFALKLLIPSFASILNTRLLVNPLDEFCFL
jgi:hypothetical protein